MPILLAPLCALLLGQSQPTYAAELDSLLKSFVDKGGAPSVSIAVIRDGKVEYAKGFGMADLENNVPATPNHVYRLGSITKQFTATIIMQLVQEGKLSLSDTLGKILPSSPEAWRKITIRQLLNHTSGIKNYTDIKGLFEGRAMKPTTPWEVALTVKNDPLDFPPSSKWNYSNTGYVLLGLVIEKLDNRSYAKSLQTRILNPLGMTSTYFRSEQAVVPNRAQGYSQAPKGFKHAPYLNMDWPYAAGSMESTVLDIAKWDAALYGNKILQQAWLQKMWTKEKLSTGEELNYGFGWGMSEMNGSKVVSHGGGIHGFTTQFTRVIDKRISVIVLENMDDASPEILAKKALYIAEPSLKPKPEPVKLDTNIQADKDARTLLESALAGKLVRDKISPDLNAKLTDDTISSTSAQLQALGALSEFKLTNVKEVGGNQVRTYNIMLGSTSLKFVVSINKAGLYTGMRLMPAE